MQNFSTLRYLAIRLQYLWLKREALRYIPLSRGAESESESEPPGVVATSQESESESIKLTRLCLRNALFESVYAGENLHALLGNNLCTYRLGMAETFILNLLMITNWRCLLSYLRDSVSQKPLFLPETGKT